MNYPLARTEREILDLAMNEAAEELSQADEPDIVRVIAKSDLRAAMVSVSAVHVSDVIRDFIVRLMAASRDEPERIPGVGEHLSHPISPRGTIMLACTAQARAWLNERDHVLPEDVIELAPDVLRHRFGLTYRAEADGVEPDSVVRALLERIDVV